MHDSRFRDAFFSRTGPAALVGFAASCLFAGLPAFAQTGDCSVDRCAPGTIPLVDADGDVDMSDFSVFSLNFTGAR